EVPHVSVTGLDAGRPLPLIVNFFPGTATSGFVVSVVIVAAGTAAGAMGPGSAATPARPGIASGVGVPEAIAGTSIVAPAAAATVTAIFMWRFMAVVSFSLSLG